MSDELKRAMMLGAEHERLPKLIEVSGLREMVDEMRATMAAQAAAQIALTEAVTKVVAAIDQKELKSTDVSELTKAVLMLQQKTPEPVQEHVPWTVDFDRDSRGDIKSGIRLTPMTRQLDS